MKANTAHQLYAESEWDALLREEEAGHEADQRAAIRPELSAAWSKLKEAISSAVRACYYDLAVAFSRASVQEHRGPVQRLLCRRAGSVFDRASL